MAENNGESMFFLNKTFIQRRNYRRQLKFNCITIKQNKRDMGAHSSSGA